MKKIYTTALAVFIFVAMTSSAVFAERLVVAQNSAPTTATTKSGFVPKPVPITKEMVQKAMSYTDAQSIRAEVEKLNKKVQKLEEADKTLWSKLFGKKKGALVALEGRLQSAIKTATDNSTAAQARAEEAFKLAEVADGKATEVSTKIKEISDTCKSGMEAIKGEVETMRKIGTWLFIGFGVVIIGIFILALFPIRKKN